MSAGNVVPLRSAEAAPVATEREIYLRIFEHSKDSVFLVAPTGTILFANPKAVEDTSYESDELINLDFISLFLPDEQGAVKTLLEATLQWNTGVDPQRVLKRKTGRKIIVEMTTSIVEFEGQKTLFCNVRDITARVKAEEKIKHYSKELETINAELEDRVKARTADLATANENITRQKKEIDDVMANIQQAIFTISRELRINSEHSKFVTEVFGARPAAGADIAEFLYSGEALVKIGGPIKDSLAMAFDSPETWEMIRDLMPRELVYEKPITGGGTDPRDLKLEWCPIMDGATILKMMVICLDVTEQKRLAAEIARREAAHSEQLELISQIISHPPELVCQWVKDTRRMLLETKKYFEAAQGGFTDEILKGLMRTLHTIKGSARQFRMDSIQKRAHEIESKVVAIIPSPPTGTAAAELLDHLLAEFAPLEAGLLDIHTLYDKTAGGSGEGASTGDTISVPFEKISALLETIPSNKALVSTEAVRTAVSWLVRTPIKPLFDRLEQTANSLAQELNKTIEIVRVGDQVALDFRYLGPLYDAFLHAIRNSIDHGSESPEDRMAAGKNPAFRLVLSAELVQDDYVMIEISDDGRGVDVERVKARALERNLATEQELKRVSPEQIIQFIFESGFSTKNEVSFLSGRGVGLDVVKSVVEKELAGEVIMHSEPGKGTRLSARVPLDAFRGSAGRDRLFAWGPTFPKKELEKILDVPIADLEAPPANPEKIIALTDAAGLSTVNPEFKIPRERILCVGGLEPNALVELASTSGVRHFADLTGPSSSPYLKASVRKLSGTKIWGLESYLWPGTSVQSFKLLDYGTKNEVIEHLTGFVSKLRAFSALPGLLGTVADEMIMNAMFDAPRDATGKEKYNHLPRTHRLVLEPQEEVTFRFAADPCFVALSIEDPHGALSYETLTRYLKKCYAKGTDQIDKKAGGAGLGLFTVFDSAHCLIVNVEPGKRTEMIALVHLTKSFEKYQRTGKSFSYFTQK